MPLARRLALPILLLGLLAGGAAAGEAEGMLAYQRGEFEAALRELQPAAAAGSVRARSMPTGFGISRRRTGTSAGKASVTTRIMARGRR